MERLAGHLLVLVIFVLLSSYRVMSTDHGFCSRGEFLDTNSKTGSLSCLPCPLGTYMDELKHTNIECAECSLAEDFNHEFETQPCTRTKDAIILCEKNYFRVEPGSLLPGFCKKCLECGVGRKSRRPFEIQPCGTYTDTVCGEHPAVFVHI